jgi:HAD superfamily hydrolase (TIGR01548 family)
MGPADVIAAMQRVAPPYPVGTPSLVAARRALRRDRMAMQRRVAQVRQAREVLTRELARWAMEPVASQANFVSTDAPRAAWLYDGLAGLGIAVRRLEGTQGPRVRITCPIDDGDAARLHAALASVLAPEALLFDLDGVIADVSASYRATILSTAARFGARATPDDVRARKAAGNANDDWALTHELVTGSGVRATLDEVTAAFESIYQGSAAVLGFRSRETLIPAATLLRELAARLPLAIVTGRPRVDAERFLAEHAIAGSFQVVVCREDAPLKPDPAPVRLAMQHLGVTRAWMVGDTPDDIRSARAAGVVPLGILAPGDPAAGQAALLAAGAARVLTTIEDLLPCLP